MLLVPTAWMADELVGSRKLKRIKVMSYDQARNGKLRGALHHPLEYAIDEAQVLLAQTLGMPNLPALIVVGSN